MVSLSRCAAITLTNACNALGRGNVGRLARSDRARGLADQRAQYHTSSLHRRRGKLGRQRSPVSRRHQIRQRLETRCLECSLRKSVSPVGRKRHALVPRDSAHPPSTSKSSARSALDRSSCVTPSDGSLGSAARNGSSNSATVVRVRLRDLRREQRGVQSLAPQPIQKRDRDILPQLDSQQAGRLRGAVRESAESDTAPA